MTRIWTALLAAFAAVLTLAGPAGAQAPRPVVSGAAGMANLFRFDDRSYGTELNLGAGMGLEWERWGLDADVHRTIGLTPRAVQCGVITVPCAGSAREGFVEATMLSGGASYFFGDARVRPFVAGSAGVLWTELVESLTLVGEDSATLLEFTERDASLALGAGAGVDIWLTPSLALRPEFRAYSVTAGSRVNLNVNRATIGVRYRW
jgi:opacity protein-like surface antigen